MRQGGITCSYEVLTRWLLLSMWRIDEKEKIEWIPGNCFAMIAVVQARDDDGLG